MRGLVKYILWCFTALTVGCSNDLEEQTTPDINADGEVAVALDFELFDSKALDSDATHKLLKSSVLKIYDGLGKIVRRYEPATEAPSYLYLAENYYTATLRAGSEMSPTTIPDSLTYYGEDLFGVAQDYISKIVIPCYMVNTAVTVEFDAESFEANIMEGYKVTVAPVDEITDAVLADGYKEKYVFTADSAKTSYFILEEGRNTMAWRFDGVRQDPDKVDGVPFTMSGTIENTDPNTENKLTFSYDKYLIVKNSLNIGVDDSTDDSDHLFDFSLQPAFTTDGSFVMSEVQVASVKSPSVFNYNIESYDPLTTIEILNGDIVVETLDITNGGSANSEYVSYIATGESSGKLTIKSEIFNTTFTKGGDNTITIAATSVDDANVKSIGTTKLTATQTGIDAIQDVDLWKNSATITAAIVDGFDSAQLIVNEVGSDVEQRYDLNNIGGNKYSISVSPEWNMTENGELDYYTPLGGIWFRNNYTVKLIVNDTEIDNLTFNTIPTTGSDEDNSDKIPDGDMNSSSLSCFGVDKSTDSNTWSSGNMKAIVVNVILCAQDTYDGVKCAKLATTSAMSVIAAGNLFYGQFEAGSTSGTAKFGQPFTWSKRPKTFKVRYAATIIEGEIIGSDSIKYDHDRARIYMAIVDWGSRRNITAGTSGKPNGAWDPTDTQEIKEGKIIGYASKFIDESTTDEKLHDLELEIYYYDEKIQPSKTYTLVISCASSAYGDYMKGEVGNTLWVDDFEFGY